MKPLRPEDEQAESDLCGHIFNVSGVMVGAVLTVIGLLNVIVTIKQVNTLADDILALTSVLFLGSCMCAYWALRSRDRRKRLRLERIADGVFIAAMVLAVLSGLFVTYAFAVFS